MTTTMYEEHENSPKKMHKNKYEGLKAFPSSRIIIKLNVDVKRKVVGEN